jgi:bifunctional UDP-N-acetylglucosamine pyrophosphorylase/glucosamine-1-phosphate N-acetyltransferase
MQAVILAGGRGKRMLHLTNDKPKPILEVFGKSLIEWKLDEIGDFVDEAIIVVGYLGPVIKKRLGSRYKGIKLTYVLQKQQIGTADALFCTKKKIKGDFIVMMGDDFSDGKDLNKLSKEKGWVVLAKKNDKQRNGARLIMKKGKLVRIIENQVLNKGDLMNTGCYKLDKEIFNLPMVKIESGEFGLPQTIGSAIGDRDVKVMLTKNWMPVTSPEDIELAHTFIKKGRSRGSAL